MILRLSLLYWEDMAMTDTFTCTHCRGEHPLTKRTEFNGQDLCPDCLAEDTILCRDCGRRIWADENEGSEDHPLCQHCYERRYTNCDRCGALLRTHQALYMYGDDDEEHAYCDTCYHQVSAGVHDYCYKPVPIFYGDGPRYLGVELEIDEAGESGRQARWLCEAANREHEHIYIKHDGSLEDGLEIVTHPMTLDYHRTEMPWPEVIRCALDMGYLSHQAGTCGLHVHVNRSSLGDTAEQREDTIARILFFVENHWNELLRFSRRTGKQMEKWAARYGRKDDPKAVLHSAKASENGRYTCVNLNCVDTIEFRMFRGTLKYNTLIATLQIVDRICDVALFLSDEEVQNLTWSEFVSSLREDKTPELIQYLKERRLYVNDPVQVSEEV